MASSSRLTKKHPTKQDTSAPFWLLCHVIVPGLFRKGGAGAASTDEHDREEGHPPPPPKTAEGADAGYSR